MKIAHVTEAWSGGISSYVRTLIRQQVAAGHEVRLIYSPGRSGTNFDPPCDVALYPYQSSRNPLKLAQCARAVREAMRGFQPDIVHLHSTFPGVYGRLLRHEFPVVYCAHGWAFTQESGTLKRMIYAGVERLLAGWGDGIIDISQFEYDAARAHGVHARVHDVVLSGADDVVEDLPAVGYAVDPGGRNIGFIGRLDHKKGFDLLYAYFRDHRPEGVHLHVIGAADRDGGDYSDIPGVTFHGWVDSAEIDAHIRKFDAVIAPSRHEGFGLVVIEAMRNGVPAIVARDTAMPELVRHGVDGFVFDIHAMADALPEIFAQDFAAMGVAARATYEARFTSARMAADIMRFYETVLHTRSAS